MRHGANKGCRAAALLAVSPALLAGLLAAGTAQAQNAYITNTGSGTVSVIDTRTNGLVGSPIAVSSRPYGVAAAPDGSRVYVTNQFSFSVSVIDTRTNSIVGTPIPVGNGPLGVAVTPDGSKVYVANQLDDTVSVIETRTNTVVDTDPTTDGVNPIPVGRFPVGVAVTPDGGRVYVANSFSDTVSVIDTRTNTVVDTDPTTDGVNPIPVGDAPTGVAAAPDGSRVYVTNRLDDTVSVINAATNSVVGLPIAVGRDPWGVAARRTAAGSTSPTGPPTPSR